MIIDQLFTRPIFEAADPSRLIAIITLSQAYNADEPTKEVDLTGRFQGDVKSQMNQAADYLTQFLQSKGFNFTSIQLKYQGMVMNAQNLGSMTPQSDWEKEAEATANQMRVKRPVQNTTPALKEFAPGGDDDSGNYLKALASAWYNGTYDSGSLQKGIKTKEDIERLLDRGIVAPDGVTRKYNIDYNSDFDGVIIFSDDYYEHGDDDETDSRTGQPFGPYDYMEFSDDDLSESAMAEGRKKKKKTSRSLGRYFFPGYGYYGSGDAGEGGGDGGGGESAKSGMAEGGFPKKISQKEVDKFQKKHNDKLTGREVNRQEQEKKPADNNKKQGVAEDTNTKQHLDFDSLYGKIFKITDNSGDSNRPGFSIVTPLNGESWNWRERPEFKKIVKQKLNDPGFLGDHKYQQIVDAMAGNKFNSKKHLVKEQGVAEGLFGIEDKIKGKIQNVVSDLSDIPGMWDHKAQTFTDAGMEKLQSVLKNNPKYIKYALNLDYRDYESEGMAEGLTEMDKSEPSAGRDGPPRPGPDREAKPVAAKKATRDAGRMLNKAFRDSHKKKDVKEDQEIYSTSPVELARTAPGIKMAKMAGQSAVAAAKNKLDSLRAKNPEQWDKAMQQGSAYGIPGPPQFPADAGRLMGDRAEYMKKVKSAPSEWDDTTGSIGMDPQMKSPFPPLMKKLQAAMVKEGRVKELADDLKTLADADFMKKYGKAKAAIRADMTKLDEAQTNYTPAEMSDILSGKKTQQQVDAERAKKPLKEIDAPAMPAAPAAPAAPTQPAAPAKPAATTPVAAKPAGQQPFKPNQTMDPQQAAAANKAAQEFMQGLMAQLQQIKPVAESRKLNENWFTDKVAAAANWMQQKLKENPLIEIGLRFLPVTSTILAITDVIGAIKGGNLADATRMIANLIPGGQQLAQAVGAGQAVASGDIAGAAQKAASAAGLKDVASGISAGQLAQAVSETAPVNELSTNQLARYKTAAAKAAIRKDMKRVDEAGISRLGKKDIDFRDGFVGDEPEFFEPDVRIGKPVERYDREDEFMAAFQGAGQQNADNSRPLEPGEFRTNDGRIFRFVTDPAAAPAKKEVQWIPSSEADSIASWKANNPGKSSADSAAASGLPKMRFDRASNSLVPVNAPPALDLSPKTDSIKSGSNPNIDAKTRANALAYAAQQNAPAAAAKQKVDWKTIYALNKATIGSNPNIIKPRMQLNMPNGTIYLVQPGDTLTKIATKQSQINELSTDKLAQYKTAAARDARAADQEGDVKRGDKRFSGIVKATKKQFDNDAKQVDESRAARRALMARIVNHR